MKKLVGITGLILICCVCIGALYTPSEAVNIEASTVATHLDDIYVIKAENNKIVVYRKNEEMPYIVTDTYINNLPKGDILRLIEGIEIYGEKNLQKSLQDYCS